MPECRLMLDRRSRGDRRLTAAEEVNHVEEIEIIEDGAYSNEA
ncbi:MAG: hypothetical protein ACRDXX_21470 [Stackebrandtia sp.]